MPGIVRGPRVLVAWADRPASAAAFLVFGLAVLTADIAYEAGSGQARLSLDLPDWLAAPLAAIVLLPLIRWVKPSLARRLAGRRFGKPAAEPSSSSPAANPLRHLLVRTPRSIRLIEADAIRSIEADGRYVRIYAGADRHLAQYTLSELAGRLDQRCFVRVHRSVIVNLSRVRALRTDDYRDFEILLDDGRAVRLSRTYRETFERALGSRL